ncbi:MAG TPA: ABC transporter permease [Candidatus Acidoferrales bacterium]|nr:ABC transporter permease [Candidatus Acidoferrales bacterium]
MRAVRAWLIRLRGLFGKDRRDAVFSAELESHLQFHIEDNLRAGIAPDEARRAALIKLGGVQQTKELHRERTGLPLIETFLQDLQFGLRMLGKNPGFTAAAVLALALGIGANTAIFSVVDAVLLHSLPYRDASRLMWVTTFLPRTGQSIVVHPDYFGWRQQNHVFEDMAAYSPDREDTLTGAGEPVRLSSTLVTYSFFRVLGVEPRLGREFSQAEDRPKGPRVAILSDTLWKQRFGADRNVVGRVIALNGDAYTVVGVMPPEFEFPENGNAEILLPFALPDTPVAVDQALFLVRIVGRLRPKITPAAASADLDGILDHLHSMYPAGYAKMLAGAQTRVISLHDREVGNVRPALFVLLGAVGFLLLIACANVANLQLARAIAREKEVAIRRALGAGRVRIARQLLTESTLVSVLGGAAGMLLAFWALSAMRLAGPRNIPHMGGARLDWRVLLFTLTASLATGILFGLAPALAALRTPVNEPLKQSGSQSASSSGRVRRSQKLLMAAEVALAFVLCIGAGLLTRSLICLISIPPGFDGRGVLTAQIDLPISSYREPEQWHHFYSELLIRLGSLPGVSVVGGASVLPLRGSTSSSVMTIEGDPAPDLGAARVFVNTATPGYFSALRIPLIAGRAIDERDGATTMPTAVVNQVLVRRYFPHRDPVGARFKLPWGDWRTIVGVIQDTKQNGIAAEIEPEIFLTMQQSVSNPEMTLVIRSSVPPDSLASAVRVSVAALDPNLPVYGIQTMDDLLAGQVASQRFNSYLLAAFALLALLLAAVGIYGVLAYTVSQRTREIGIRLALGAESSNVRRMILRHGLGIALLGIGIGLAASFGLTRVLRSLLYTVKPTDPVTFTAVSLALVLVTLAACWIPARRAARVNPMVALRHE